MTQFTERETANSFLRERNVVTATEQKNESTLASITKPIFHVLKYF